MRKYQPFVREPLPKDLSEMIGKQFGKLTVIGQSEFRSNGHSHVQVKCTCGAERPARVRGLLDGQINSCGGEAHRAIARVQAVWTQDEVSDLVAAASKSAMDSVRRWKRPTMSYKTYAMVGIGFDHMVKIGRANDLEERVCDLQMGSPVPLVIIAMVDGDIERKMHKILDAHRAHGEWFRRTPEVDEAIGAMLQPVRIEALALMNNRAGKPIGSKCRCKLCGELGHFAKTCVRRQADHANGRRI